MSGFMNLMMIAYILMISCLQHIRSSQQRKTKVKISRHLQLMSKHASLDLAAVRVPSGFLHLEFSISAQASSLCSVILQASELPLEF